MYATKQTARKSAGGRVGPYTLASDQVEDEGEEIGDTGEDEEYEDRVCATLADDVEMATETERLQDLRQWLDCARQKIDSELDKGAARDKELVVSYERRVEDLRKELEVLTYARAKLHRHLQAQATQDSTGQAIEQAIRDHGDSVADAINEGIVREIADQGSEILEYLNNH